MKIASKQISRILSAFTKITGISITSTSSNVDVTSALTSALSTAGDNSTAVPLVNSSGGTVAGVVITAPSNRCEIYDSTTKIKIQTAANYEVYGKLTYSSPSYTLSFYYLDNTGTENAYTFASNETIDFDFVYRFTLDQLPADSIVAIITKNINQDPKSTGSTLKAEILTVTGTNVLSAVSIAPNTSYPISLIINGQSIDNLSGSPAFTVSGTAVTWSQTNAGFALNTTDYVVIRYQI